MYQPINVTYEAVTSLYRANQILQELNNCSIIAWDLEVATKYTDEDISAIQEEIAVIEKRIQDNLYT